MLSFPKDFLARHIRELTRHVRNHAWDQCEKSGILTIGEASPIQWKGVGRLIGPDGVVHGMTNKWTTQALTDMLSVYVDSGSQSANWYFAPFSNNGATPAIGWTAANFNSNATEVTNYDEATRQAWVNATPSGSSVGTTTDATITASTGGLSIAGCGVLNQSGKGSTAGILLIALKNTSGTAVAYSEGDQPTIGYTLTLTAV